MRKIVFLCLLLTATLPSCKQSEKKSNETSMHTFYVGTYTNGNSEGIYKFFLNDSGQMRAGGLAVKTENPSYLTFSADKKYLITLNETNTKNGGGTVLTYAFRNDSLIASGASLSGGAHPCHISCNEAGYIITSNYSGGNISLLKITDNGGLSPLLDLKQHEGKGSNENRQKSPHAHSAWFVPKSNKVLSCDLGTDELWIYELDESNNKLLTAKQSKLKINEGAGPRHLCFHPSKPWTYVVNELNSTVSLIKINIENDYYLDAVISTLPDDYKGQNTCADIHISKNGKYLYASNRGHNSIAVFSVNQDNGTLKPVGYQSVFGKTPRNFALSPDNKFLLVANQNSNNIVAFKRNENTGLLTICDEISTPNPVCIKF